ncbi:hypothetical protein JAAARDRAFT_386503 [Jaapia argillacea MUCL 33604]|uniref:F-box domain-containing protein n=1 Tax=Jaapia argillacea MUCL 33604 TaxID=933084 RepID=A0A067QBW0_9AGAM|nr:hypothetical protein JAAARDRAFT_386503 [Jaapia argillacea MUCL 33604]
MFAASFLGIPPELRIIIYEFYLDDHRRVKSKRQPSNEHLRILRTCKSISHEAADSFWQYISLRHERQIRGFLAADHCVARIRYADVANDGRMVQSPNMQPTPVSQLRSAISRMASLQFLRVFECRQGFPTSDLHNLALFSLQFEKSLYPPDSSRDLLSYELFIDPDTRAQMFDVISPRHVQKLRVSGNCHLPLQQATPALRHLTLFAITGNYFDRHSLETCFSGSRLDSFIYGMGHRLGFEIRDRHLHSLITHLGGSHLRKLVLVGCSRLTTDAIAECLLHTSALEYFALSIATVNELRRNFILALPRTLRIVKLQVTHVWYAIPLLQEERGLCDALEMEVLKRVPRPIAVHVNFHNSLMNEGDRAERWRRIAGEAGFSFRIGPWEENEEI